jgi:hypothetical protein
MTDPTGPLTDLGYGRIIRGGAYSENLLYARVSAQSWVSPTVPHEYRGFRLARTVHTDADEDGVVAAIDCDDDDPSVYPYAAKSAKSRRLLPFGN